MSTGDINKINNTILTLCNFITSHDGHGPKTQQSMQMNPVQFLVLFKIRCAIILHSPI